MTDIADTVAPKSDQLNGDDLLSGPMTFTVAEVRVSDNAEQPVSIVLGEFPRSRPFKPSKTVRRILIAGWGKKSQEYVGRRFTLYREDSVKFAGEAVGGIRVSHMSHLDRDLTISLNETRGKKATHTVRRLVEERQDPLQTRIDAMLTAYSKASVTHAMLEAHEGRAVSEWDAGNVENLVALFEALKSGEKQKADEFPELGEA